MIGDDGIVAALADIVFDCRHPAGLARFWAGVLDDYEVAPYDHKELARLRAIGVTDVENDPTVLVQPSNSAGPRLWFQIVPEDKIVKNRVHLDLRSHTVDTEVERLLGLGASLQEDQPNDGLVVLRDPEGNEFCLLRL